ncbi:hypothetical protein HK100_004635 [Physocladia obscura]|uniref:Tse2 ADP-ribosyltransferase toxin domain-containing protein n=1 Tax=Physocladia obscura TaxID=109957 RepID=A0AAD5SV53_9FUNG|nr:hypothetical protein HK100_004635 [Physocladia obscura]
MPTGSPFSPQRLCVTSMAPHAYTACNTAPHFPKILLFFHEYTEHYSLQPANEMPLTSFNKLLTNYFKSLASVSKNERLQDYDDVDDQDN